MVRATSSSSVPRLSLVSTDVASSVICSVARAASDDTSMEKKVPAITDTSAGDMPKLDDVLLHGRSGREIAYLYTTWWRGLEIAPHLLWLDNGIGGDLRYQFDLTELQAVSQVHGVVLWSRGIIDYDYAGEDTE
jgi:hypothetical protein